MTKKINGDPKNAAQKNNLQQEDVYIEEDIAEDTTTETTIKTANKPLSPEDVIIPPKPKGSIAGKIVIGVLVLLFIGIIIIRIIGAGQFEPVAEALPVHVTVAQVEVGSVSVTTSITGQVQSSDSAMIMGGGASEVGRIYVAVGDYVERGARLFSLDTTQLQGGLNQATIARDMAAGGINQAAVARDLAQGGINQATIAYDMALDGVGQAERNLERTRELYEAGATPRIMLEQAESALNAAQAGLRQAEVALSSAQAGARQAEAALSSAQTGLRQAEAGVQSARNAFDLTVFTARISGYVTEINIQEGAFPVINPAIVIHDLNNLEITANVSEYLVGQLQVGMQAMYRISAVSDALYYGTLDTVALAPASMGLTFPITVSLSGVNDARIRPGMFAEIILVANQRDNVLTIPSQAVIIRGGRSLVAVLDNQNIPQLREVETGLDNGTTVEVVSGLRSGETIITQGQHFISEGEAVIIVED